MIVVMHGFSSDVVDQIAQTYSFQVIDAFDRITGEGNQIVMFDKVRQATSQQLFLRGMVQYRKQIAATISVGCTVDFFVRFCTQNGNFFTVDMTNPDDMIDDLHQIFRQALGHAHPLQP